MPGDVGCDPLVAVCSSQAKGVTVYLNYVHQEENAYLACIKNTLLKVPALGVKHSCMCVWCVCACSRGPKLSVSKRVETVGQRMTPYRRKTPWQEKTFNNRSSFTFTNLILGSYCLSFRSDLRTNYVFAVSKTTFKFMRGS